MRELEHVRGMPDLDRFLQELPPKLERNVLRGGVRAAARLVANRAKANIHSVSGKTARDVKIGTRTGGGEVVGYVVAKGFKSKWLEYGTRPHKIKPKNRKALAFGSVTVEEVDHPGARPHPFMRPAIDTEAQRAVVVMAEYMKERLATKYGLDTSDVQVGVEESP